MPTIYDRVAPAGTSLQRQSHIRRLQSSIANLTGELSSGRINDPGRELGVGSSLLYQLHSDVKLRESIATSTKTAGLRLETMQTALTAIGRVMTETSAETLKVKTLEGIGRDVLAAQARESLREMADLLNTRHDGSAVFAGTDGAATPIKSPDGLLALAQTMLSDAVAANGGPLDAAAVDALLNGVDGLGSVFDDTNTDPTRRFVGAVYGATLDGQPSRIRIGPTETLSYDVTAEKPAFREAIRSLVTLTLLDAPASQISEEGKATLLDSAGEAIRGASSKLTVVAGILGAKEKQIERSTEIQRSAAQAAATQINFLEEADPYVTADRLKASQLQLEATYAITARLADLSLVNFLR